MHTHTFNSFSKLIPMYLSKIFHFCKLRSVIGIKMSQQWDVPILSLCLISSSLCVPPKQTQLDKIQIFCLYWLSQKPGQRGLSSSVDIPVYIRTFFCLFCHLSKQIIFDRQGLHLYTTVLDHVCLTSVIVSVMLHNGGVCNGCIKKWCLHNSKMCHIMILFKTAM
jgi:hypothetical protein